MDNKMKTYTKTLVPALALSFGIFTNCLAETEVKIVASDAAALDNLGGENAISISGDYAIVGALGNDSGGDNKGAAYIYFRSGSSWTQQAKLNASDAVDFDQFGIAVAIDGDYAIVSSSSDDDGASNSGSAYIFKRSGTSWTEEDKITASDPAANDGFGNSVAISGDYAIVGTVLNDDAGTSSGSAYIFHRSGTSWTEQEKITASDADAGDRFGGQVSINGDYVIVGARHNSDAGSSSGSAYIFSRSGTTWTEQQKITANDAATDDYFGQSVSINGDYVIVGAWGDDDGASNSGSAYIFNRSGATWTQQAKFNANDAEANHRFGYAVSIDGNNAIIGAFLDDDGVSNSGSAYIFSRSGTSWTQQGKVRANDAAADDYFGVSVSISGDYSIAGAFRDDDGGDSSGSAYIFTGSDIGLAVELDSFTARQIENSIQLNWKTASEKDNEGFNVYRKVGNGTFVQIASYKGNSELLGALNSSTANYYTFVDNSELRNGETYTYYISDVETNGIETKHEKSAETVRFILNEEIAQTKLDYVLAQNFPNPFNPSTQIDFQIAKTQDVRLQIFNLKGELVKELVNEKMNEGSHSAKWDGTDSFGNQVSSGTYFYKLSAGIFSKTNKMVLLK
ncbi:MAG: T9SS C-terminal target domain-containing protein [Calditrichaeota bacterium]|nr:MAG: T9SS C-terminal target domain-containing protein [Calditrichota bacterium]